MKSSFEKGESNFEQQSKQAMETWNKNEEKRVKLEIEANEDLKKFREKLDRGEVVEPDKNLQERKKKEKKDENVDYDKVIQEEIASAEAEAERLKQQRLKDVHEIQRNYNRETQQLNLM